MSNITCIDVANYFRSLVNDELGDFISNLKLQKLVYYAQGFHLAVFNKPLFHEPILAWTHGPVIDSLYHTLKQYGSSPIPRSEAFDSNKFSQEVTELLNDVYNAYGQYDAWKLRNLTHEEPPWAETYKRNPGGVIPLPAMHEYFATQLQ